MRRTKIVLMLCLSVMVIFTTACEKDSVQPTTKTPPSKQSVTEKPEPPMQKKKNVTPKEPSSKPAQKESQAKTTTVVTPEKNATPSTTTKVVETTATVQVSGYQGKTILSTTKVPIKQGDTILLATQTILKARGIPLSVRGSGAAAYVEGINNVFEFDHGPTSGWIVYLNGKEINRSAGTLEVKKGDQVLWKYSTEVTGAGG